MQATRTQQGPLHCRPGLQVVTAQRPPNCGAQDMNRNDARSTRQNNNGNRRGLECPEERDYYPYWAPNPWRDIAVITSNPSRCPYYKTASTATRGECRTAKEFYGKADAKDLYSTKCPGFTDVDNKSPFQRRAEGLWFNNRDQCVKHGNK